MAGTSWPTLTAGAKAKASEVESKFDWAEQDIVPHAAGTKTDATYDVGESNFRFRDGFFSRILLVGFGSAGAPSRAFTGDTDTGSYRSAANTYAIATAGILRLSIDGINLNSTLPFLGPSGTVSLPTHSYAGDSDTGWFRNASGDQRATSNGTEIFQIFSTGVSASANKIIFVRDGTTAAPGLTWNADPNTGFTRQGTDDLSLSTAGVIAQRWDANGIITKPLQSSFLAYNSATDDNVTGNGISVTVEFDTERYDQNSDFDNSTDTFTAPVTGIYALCATVTLSGLLTSSHGQVLINLITSNEVYQTRHSAVTVWPISTQEFSISIFADMDSSDTVTVQVIVAGGSQDVDILDPDIGRLRTFFSGSLIN